MENYEKFSQMENEPVEIGKLVDFDQEYFKSLEGENGWIALGNEDYQKNFSNQKYFVVLGTNGEKLGIIGVYDTLEDKNLTHTVIDPKYRGLGLAGKLQDYLMKELGLPFITATIDLNNNPSRKMMEKLQQTHPDEVKKVSDENYEKKVNKVKYIYERKKGK